MTDREKELERLLRDVLDLGIECIRDGEPCPAPGCDCGSCATISEVRAFLASAPAQDPIMESARAAIVLERCDCGDCHICRPVGRKP